MKKLSILFLSALALGTIVTSCSKDDESPSVAAKWKYTTSTYTKAGTTTAPTPITDPSCTDKSYLDLSSGSKFEQQIVGTQDEPCAVNKANGDYTYKNNVLTFVVGSNSKNFQVESVTSSKLVLKTVNPSDAGEYITITLVK